MRRPHLSKLWKEMRRNNVDIEGKNIPGKDNSQCKGPGVGACFTCLRKNSRGMSNEECR